MCRIAGMVNPHLSRAAIEDTVTRMCDLQKHGGPDDWGIYSSPADNLVLGNRRLALIDLSPAGHQPMEYQGRYHITYNGELYNFSVLKAELEKLGYYFNNHTDTEVVAAAFAHWGVQSFARFNGMFAFALWDNVEKELYLVRDTAGMKPLYYSTISGSLTFASEMRAFKAVPFLQRANHKWPVYMMAYGHIPEPISMLADVKPLTKGWFLKYTVQDQSYTLQSYAHYSYSNHLDNSQTAGKATKEALEQAVSSHLVADAPLGIFLSGGLDSAIIAMLATKRRPGNVKTLSIYVEDADFSEKEYQDTLIERFKWKYYQHLLTEKEFNDTFPAILNNMDMPGCDGLNTWFISKYAAAEGFKAVLSGIGGDELFGGYPSFKRIGTAKLLQSLPFLTAVVNAHTNIKQLNRLAYLRIPGIKGIYLFLRGHFTPYEIARQLDADEKEIWALLNEEPLCADISRLSKKNQASWMEFNLYMQNQLLRDADVMSMAHGVEIRLPFLDNNVIQLALGLHSAIKYTGSMPKEFLVNIFKNELPETIWKRPKMGFSFPFTKWFSNSGYVEEKMTSGREATRLNYEKFAKGKLHWSQLMSLINLRNHGLA